MLSSGVLEDLIQYYRNLVGVIYFGRFFRNLLMCCRVYDEVFIMMQLILSWWR